MSSKPETILKGNGVSPGIAIGHALKLDSHNRVIVKLFIRDEQVEDEVRRVEHAIQVSREQLEILKGKLEEKVGHEHSFILDVHLLMLEDHTLIADILERIRRYRANAEWAVREATDRIRRGYESLDDEYFRERASDIGNVVERILLNLSDEAPAIRVAIPDELIIVCHEFNPSTFASIDLLKLRGLALEAGGRTSHTAIIARSLRIPAVMELRGSLSSITTGDLVLVNGDDGQLVVNPSPTRLESMREQLNIFKASAQIPVQLNGTRGTKDGVPVTLQANIELPGEVGAAQKCGAEGIGLFRSEFLFFRHPQGFPSMDEQLEEYRALGRAMYPHAVSVRTLDAGADKLVSGTDSSAPPNPSMGLRGIRLSLVESDQILLPQLEAILRASAHANVEIVLPMISNVEEIWEVRSTLDKIRVRLAAASVAVGERVPVGAMIEVPAAVLSLEAIAGAVDFLCVGTNDLIQYILAVDRGNPQVAHLFQPLHPSVLQCLNRIASVASAFRKPARICGEMSSNPFFAVLLLGMGFRQFSMNSVSIPIIRRVIGQVTLEDCRRIAAQATHFITARETAEYLIDAVSRLVTIDLGRHVKEVRSPVATIS